MRKIVAAAVILILMFVSAGIAQQKSKKPDLLVDLKFVPQESVGMNSVALPGSFIDRTFDAGVEDSRNVADARILGEGTDDDDRTFPIRATVDIVPFVSESIIQLATAQGLKKDSSADRRLEFRLTRFAVHESNKALGSTYAAEVHLAFVLVDAKGLKLAEGATSGTANRYGRARSGANCSEVLSDALKEAFTKALADQEVQAAWMSGSSSAVSATLLGGQKTLEERLKKLDDLLGKGLITKEEHAIARAAILKGS